MIGHGPGQVVKMKSAIQILPANLLGTERLPVLIHELEGRHGSHKQAAGGSKER